MNNLSEGSLSYLHDSVPFPVIQLMKFLPFHIYLQAEKGIPSLRSKRAFPCESNLVHRGLVRRERGIGQYMNEELLGSPGTSQNKLLHWF